MGLHENVKTHWIKPESHFNTKGVLIKDPFSTWKCHLSWLGQNQSRFVVSWISFIGWLETQDLFSMPYSHIVATTHWPSNKVAITVTSVLKGMSMVMFKCNDTITWTLTIHRYLSCLWWALCWACLIGLCHICYPVILY